jgi:hypothetical protein
MARRPPDPMHLTCGQLSGNVNAAGTPCRAAALTTGTTCLAHADEETRASMRFGGSQPGSGRKPRPKPDEVTRRLIEDNEAVLMAPHFRALGYEIVRDGEELRLVAVENGGAKLYGTSKDGDVCVSNHDDLGAMQQAAERLWDRVYGRPRQRQEITGEGGGPVAVETSLDLSKLSVVEKRTLLELIEKTSES